jgi:hypothetical protein
LTSKIIIFNIKNAQNMKKIALFILAMAITATINAQSVEVVSTAYKQFHRHNIKSAL